MSSVKIDMHDDHESPKSITDDFMYNNNVAQANVYIRLGFIRKVYGILSFQLLLTIIIASIAMLTPTARVYIYNNVWMVQVAVILSFVLLFAMMVKRKETPINYILLLAFTCVQAYTITVVVSFYDKVLVLEAFALTFAVTFAITLYTLQSKRDFSGWHAGLFSVLIILICAGFLQMFVWNTYMELAFSIGGAILFSLFLIYDTHMILHRVSPEEYIMASIELYLDIINLFLYILRILNAANKN